MNIHAIEGMAVLRRTYLSERLQIEEEFLSALLEARNIREADSGKSRAMVVRATGIHANKNKMLEDWYIKAKLKVNKIAEDLQAITKE